MTDNQQVVLRILLSHQGRSKAIKGMEMARLLGFRDDRSIRQVIRELIAEGYPIASSVQKPFGYFIVATRQEAEYYAQSIRSRLIEDAIRRRDFRRAADQYLTPAEQGRMF